MRSVTASLLLAACLVGCSGVEDQAKLLGTREFNEQEWATATQVQRGEMVASFLSKHKVSELTTKDVNRLLGPTNSYYKNQYPAYLVGPATVKSNYGHGYLLVFMTDNSTGKVEKVMFVPEVSK